MRLEAVFDPVEAKAAALNARLEGAAPEAVLARALDDFAGRIALVSSFGAESVVLLHMVSRIDRGLPVLFLDTEMLFPETLAYQREVADALGLTDVRAVRPDPKTLAAADPQAALHLQDPDACCALRKTRPLDAALGGFDAWITGRKRHQTGARSGLSLVEADAGGRIKINPLAHWSGEDVRRYIEVHALPRHPLVGRGYPSIGCTPCTSPVAPGESPRAGRWRGRDKEECGIHFEGGRVVRRLRAGGAG
ncbi:phosphoadenylyl-sulfate reductase [Rhodovulum euryhalinum]|uniref:Adenosine 5'-phosphosulfate reductase n=1 Tax=Rhodovulum euryhalinum TaxID=35805 RepID=A0A4R2KLR0_9RHOB|nr:phosphoadenylyl-sulfate reductase [Rhodovulum euryhalinum]TCO71659.1 phosphoadenylylsulfate reductase (thioredoxin) [Rhodovulum euryhalinum]